uniref:CASP-like protein n=2 Tax=Aegilops tauschii subsp. strangulata TaxID=200361 RepID=A0A453NIR3_AEGTS
GTEWIRDISTRAGPTLSARARDQRPLPRYPARAYASVRLHKAPQTVGQAARLRHRAPRRGRDPASEARPAALAGRHGGGGEAAGGGDVGQGGEPPPGRVRGGVGGVRAAPGPERADQDGALRPEEGRAQGRGGPLVRPCSVTDVRTAKLSPILITDRSPRILAVRARVLIVAAAVAAGYHAARLLKRLCSGGRFAGGEDGRGCARAVAWACFLLDKGCAYVVFASAVAALQACFVALTGVEPLQWSRLCNIYTRFCVQGAFGMVCGLAAAVGMALLSVFSARDLFRLYSPAGRRQARLRSESSQTGLISKNEMTRGSAGDD